MVFSIRSEIFSIQEEEEYRLTALQLSCSQMIQSVLSEACNPLTLFSLVAGGAVARTVELTCFRSLTSLTSFSTSRFAQAVPHLSSLAGILTEGGFFAGFPMIQEGGSFSTFGIGTGHGALVIGLSRVVGKYTHSNLIVSWIAQDCAVMGVDFTFETLQLREVQNIGITERWMHARAVAFQMHISGEICHFIPGVVENQAIFSLKKELYKTNFSNHKPRIPRQSLFYAMEELATPEGVVFSEIREEVFQKAQTCFTKGGGAREESSFSNHPILTQISKGDWMGAFLGLGKIPVSDLPQLLKHMAETHSDRFQDQQMKSFIAAALKRIPATEPFWADLNSDPSLAILCQFTQQHKVTPAPKVTAKKIGKREKYHKIFDHFVQNILGFEVEHGFDFTWRSGVKEKFDEYFEEHQQEDISQTHELKSYDSSLMHKIMDEEMADPRWFHRVIQAVSIEKQLRILCHREETEAVDIIEEMFRQNENAPFFEEFKKGLEKQDPAYQDARIGDKFSLFAIRIECSDSPQEQIANFRLLRRMSQFLGELASLSPNREALLSWGFFITFKREIDHYKREKPPKEIIQIVAEIIETSELHFRDFAILEDFLESESYGSIIKAAYELIAKDVPAAFSIPKTPMIASSLLKTILGSKEHLTQERLDDVIAQTDELPSETSDKLKNAISVYRHSLDFLRSTYVICFMVKRDGKSGRLISDLVERLPVAEHKNKETRKRWVLFQGLMSEFGAAHEVAIDTMNHFQLEERVIEEEIHRLRDSFSKRLLDPLMTTLELSDSEKEKLLEIYRNNSELFAQNNFFHYLGIAAQFSDETGLSALQIFTDQLLGARIEEGQIVIKERYDYLQSMGVPPSLIEKWGKTRRYSLREIVESLGIVTPEQRRRGAYQQTLKKLQGAFALPSGAFTTYFPTSLKEVERLLHQQWLTDKVAEALKPKLPDFRRVLSLFANTLVMMHEEKPVNQQSVQGIIRFFSDHASLLRTLLPETYLELIPLFKTLIKSLEEINQAKKTMIPDGHVEITADPTVFMVRGLYPTLTCQRPTEPTTNNTSGELVNPMIYGQFLIANLVLPQAGEKRIGGRMIIELGFNKGRERKRRNRISLRGDNLYSDELRFGEWLQQAVRLDGISLQIPNEEIYLPDGKHHQEKPFPSIDLENIFPDRQIHIYRDQDGG